MGLNLARAGVLLRERAVFLKPLINRPLCRHGFFEANFTKTFTIG
jgi:hypothetical protein